MRTGVELTQKTLTQKKQAKSAYGLRMRGNTMFERCLGWIGFCGNALRHECPAIAEEFLEIRSR